MKKRYHIIVYKTVGKKKEKKERILWILFDGADEGCVDVEASVEPKGPCRDFYFFEPDSSDVMFSVDGDGDEVQSDG